MLGILRHRQRFAAQRRRVAPRRAAPGQDRDADLATDDAAIGLRQRPGIRPVAHEHRIAGLEHAARLLFGIVEHRRRRDAADPPSRRLQRQRGTRVANADLAIDLDDGAATMARHPFQRIAGQAFVGTALPDVAPHPVVAGGTLAVLDQARAGSELVPGGRHRLPVFLQQIAAIEQQAGVGEPGHRHQPALAAVVGNETRKVLRLSAFGVRPQVEQVAAQQARPDHVHLQHVDLVRARREQLLVQRQPFAGVVGRRDDLQRVAGFLRPGFGSALAEFTLLADAGASDADGGRVRSGQGEQRVGRPETQTKKGANEGARRQLHAISPVFIGAGARRAIRLRPGDFLRAL